MAEGLASVVVAGLSPLAAVYYPVETLPAWLRPIALALPPAHVFEGMRTVMFDHIFRWDLFWTASALNVAHSSAACLFFLHMVRVVRRRGLLLSMGE